jgi:hypothetical protein
MIFRVTNVTGGHTKPQPITVQNQDIRHEWNVSKSVSEVSVKFDILFKYAKSRSVCLCTVIN